MPQIRQNVRASRRAKAHIRTRTVDDRTVMADPSMTVGHDHGEHDPFATATPHAPGTVSTQLLAGLPSTINPRTGKTEHGSADLAAVPGIASTDSGLTNSDLLAARQGRTHSMTLDEFLDRAAKNGGIAANQDGIHRDKVHRMLNADGPHEPSAFNAVVDGNGTVHIADGHSRTAAALLERHANNTARSHIGQGVTVNVTITRDVLGAPAASSQP